MEEHHMDDHKKNNWVLAISLFVAAFSVFFGILGVLLSLPNPFGKKAPIKRQFQRKSGELRRGN